MADFKGVIFSLDSDRTFAQEIGLRFGDRCSVQRHPQFAFFRNNLDGVPLPQGALYPSALFAQWGPTFGQFLVGRAAAKLVAKHTPPLHV